MSRNTTRTKTTRHCYSRDLHAQWRPEGSEATGPYVQEPHPFLACTTDTVTYGPNLPNWRTLLISGQSATTTLVGTKYSSKCGELSMQVDGTKYAPGFGRRAHGFNPEHWAFPAPPLATPSSVAEQSAASRFLKDYLNATQSWAGGSAVAEFAESIAFLANPIRSLYRHTFTFVGRVGRLKQVAKRDPVKYGKLLGQAWLTYAFGIAPVVSDVNSASNAVNELAENLGAVDIKRVIGSGEERSVLLTERKIVPFAPFAEYEVATHLIKEVRYIGAVRCKPPGIGAIAENFGVGFEDILPSVWEAVPWSWLIDYFVNVNEMLDSIRYLAADFAWCNKTVRNRAVKQASDVWLYIAPADTGYYTGSASGGQGYTQSAVVVRTPTDVPYPSWKIRCPGLPSQFGNVAALVLAIKGSKPVPFHFND